MMPSLVASRAPRAATERAQRPERVAALVAVRPCHAKAVRLLLDVLGPAHGVRQPRPRLERMRGIVEAQPIEGIDARVVVGPRDAEGIAPDEMHVLRLVGIQLAEEG